MKANQKFRESNTGQMSLVGIVSAFISLVVYVALLPAINDVINDALPELGSMEQTIIQLIPLILLLTIIMGIIIYGTPHWERRY